MSKQSDRQSSQTSILYRFTTGLSGTPGILICPGGAKLYTLELPWKNNASRVSCIPQGEYDLGFITSSYSGKYKNVYHVKDVPNRSGILIHSGNYLEHIKGCILVGLTSGIRHGEYTVWNSKKALAVLNSSRGMNMKSGVIRIFDNYADM